MNLLVISQLFKIIASVLVLFFTKQHLFIKIIIIIVIDYLDCPYFFTNKLKIQKVDCKSESYQKYDKLTDTICYFMILYLFIKNKNFTKNEKQIITFLFIFRLIGTTLFYIKKNKKYLFYFPNFFLELALLFSVCIVFPYLKKYKILFVSMIIFYKLIQEYLLHYKKNL